MTPNVGYFLVYSMAGHLGNPYTYIVVKTSLVGVGRLYIGHNVILSVDYLEMQVGL